MRPRKENRLPIECPVTYSGYNARREAFVTDISMGGWHVQSAEPVPPGTPLLLHVSLPDVADPVEVQLAQVQWVRGQEFGLRNVIMSEDNRMRLRRFLTENADLLNRMDPDLADAKGKALTGAPDQHVAGVSGHNVSQFAIVPPDTKALNIVEDTVLKLQSTASVLSISFGDLLTFMNWIHAAGNALDSDQPLPEAPAVEAVKLKSCVDLIQKLESRSRRIQGRQLLLESYLQGQESELGRLLSHLHNNVATLYENLGQDRKAEEIRKQAAAIRSL